MSAAAAPNTRIALSLAVGLYLVWVLATYLLEGRIHTFLRPEALGARLFYALVANILIGIGGSALVIRFMSSASAVSTQQAEFRGLGHAVIAVVIRVVIGFAFYALQGAPTMFASYRSPGAPLRTWRPRPPQGAPGWSNKRRGSTWQGPRVGAVSLRVRPGGWPPRQLPILRPRPPRRRSSRQSHRARSRA